MAGDTGIYVIQHMASGRRYVGSAVSFKKRWREHVRALDAGDHHSSYLMRCWRKYGPPAFSFTVALYCDRHNLLMYEQALIDFYQPEFNSAPRAGSQLGFRMSAESKAKLSAAARRTKNFTGKQHSDESKRRISLAKTGVRQPPEVVERRQATIRALPIPPSPPRRFSPELIRAIRARIAAGELQKHLCMEFAVSSSVLSEINTRKAYGWVE